MYFSNIADSELKQFHRTVRLTASYSELNNLDEDLFDKTQPNKLIPLFYTDTINGDSDYLTVLDNLVVLYVNYTDNDELINDLDKIYFDSVDESREFDLLHEIVTVNGKSYLKLHFFDNVSLFNLSNFTFHISQTNDGINQNNKTDMYGNCIIPLKHETGIFTVISNNTKIEWSE